MAKSSSANASRPILEPNQTDILVSDHLLKVDEVAQHLRVSSRTVWDLIRRGELDHVHVGRQIRIRRDQLAAYLDQPERQVK